MDSYHPTDRRPIASRERRVFQRLAAALARRGVSPNAISVAGMIAGLVAGVSLALTNGVDIPVGRLLFILAAICMQLRLLANMLDGMVAVEAQRASPVGELYNEVPDRVSDSAVLVGAGYAIGAEPVLGFAAALAAMLTAYLRATGKGAGVLSVFCGPMAKPHRMAVMTVVALVCAVLPSEALLRTWLGYGIIDWTLWVIIAGCIVTSVRRLTRIGRSLAGRMA